MKDTKSRARSLLTVAVVIGTFATSAIVAACSAEESKEEKSDEGIGLAQISPVANAAEASTPVDATPSPDGSSVYFIAFTSKVAEDGIRMERVPAIFKTTSAPGGVAQKLFEGAPLQSPFGITISDDGNTLFIADSSADGSEEAERSDGRVFAMSSGGGSPTALAGTEGIAPAGVEASGASLYVTGRKDGLPGLYKTGIGGGAVSPVAVGGVFQDPGGVTVTRDGIAYVIDTGSATGSQSLASVIKVTPDGKTEVLLEGLSVGHPAGIALTLDESAVLVSGLDNAEATDRVYRVQLADKTVTKLSSTIGEFYESAGLHRARNVELFAWADSHANQYGTVYVLKP
jgi:sugar lactone lactonase YvrE